MSPKSAVKNYERGETLIGVPGNPPTFAHRTDGSRYPRIQMPPKISSNLARVSGRIIKQARRRRLMRPSPPPPWAELPFDITANILHRLGVVKILETAQYVCKAWRIVCNDPSMWRVIDMPESSTVSDDSSKRPAIDKSRPSYYCSIWPVTRKSRPSSRPKPSDADLEKMSRLENMCRYAVDKSQGQLVDINLEYFASDELLDYIAERSENLTCLRLARCDQLSDDGLFEAVQGFPNLEKFHIILSSDSKYDGLFDNQYPPLISDETIEMIGESCPLLRSFALNIKTDYSRNDHRRSSCDETAYAIARSMPELRHLQLRGNGLTDEGLEAILDGCPHLESLDLHRCTNVKLVNGGLRKRCLSQIKCLRWKEYHFPNMPRPGRFVF